MVSVLVYHIGFVLQFFENLIIFQARLQVEVLLLYESSNKENMAFFSGNRPAVERNFKGHFDELLEKVSFLHPVDLDVLLVPLEGVQFGHNLVVEVLFEGRFHVEVYSQVAVQQVYEFSHQFAAILLN